MFLDFIGKLLLYRGQGKVSSSHQGAAEAVGSQDLAVALPTNTGTVLHSSFVLGVVLGWECTSEWSREFWVIISGGGEHVEFPKTTGYSHAEEQVSKWMPTFPWVDLRELWKYWPLDTGLSVVCLGIFGLIFSSHMTGRRMIQPGPFSRGPLRTHILTGKEYLLSWSSSDLPLL